MRIFSFVVLFVILATTCAMAMNPYLKENAFERTASVTIDDSDSVYDVMGTAVYVAAQEGNGYWLTAAHVVNSLETFYIDKVKVEIVDRGCDFCCDIPDEVDWALLRTPNYTPYDDTPLDYGLYLNEPLFYVNMNDRINNNKNTVTKIRVKEFYDNDVVVTTTTPQHGNSGSGVFNFEGELVGLVIGKVLGSHNTIILRVYPRMFQEW
jgi:hypothetical protein